MKELMKNTGIYKLYFTGSDNFYIGSASRSFESRLRTHLSELRRGIHHNKPLQRGYEKYGESCIVMEPLVICGTNGIIEIEEFAIRLLKPSYNASKSGATRFGVKASKEAREKMSQAARGRKLTEEHKANISKGLLKADMKISDEHREKLRMLMTGRVVSPETRDKIRKANIGKTHAEEVKRKMSITHSRPRNTKKYHFVNKDGVEVIETVYYMRKTYNLNSHVFSLISGKRKSTKGWTLKNSINEH